MKGTLTWYTREHDWASISGPWGSGGTKRNVNILNLNMWNMNILINIWLGIWRNRDDNEKSLIWVKNINLNVEMGAPSRDCSCKALTFERASSRETFVHRIQHFYTSTKTDEFSQLHQPKHQQHWPYFPPFCGTHPVAPTPPRSNSSWARLLINSSLSSCLLSTTRIHGSNLQQAQHTLVVSSSKTLPGPPLKEFLIFRILTPRFASRFASKSA